MRTPLLIGKVSVNKHGSTINVWCPFCRISHVHGYDPLDGNRPTHRCAHCADIAKSPFRDGGYYIRPERKSDWR